MDRDETVRISRLAASGKLTENDASILLVQYCMEHGKPYRETAMFVTIILRNKHLLSYYFSVALGFYERKFTICKLWSAPNPLNIQGQDRTLLQIF